MQYTVDYFIKKFEAIPEKKWFVGDYHNSDKSKSCALGHCCFTVDGLYDLMSVERRSLEKLFYDINVLVGDVNDGSEFAKGKFPQPTPKQRILAALYDIKKMQQPVEEPKVKEIIRYVAVPETISESIPETIFN
jgi:hypothetical protein